MRSKILACCLAISGLSLMTSGMAAVVMTGPGTSYSVKVTSYKQLTFRNTVRQQYDFSCGSAALATLLNYHYEYPTSEATIFSGMYSQGDRVKIRRFGFSMGDMQRYLASRGIPSNGYDIDLSKLAEVNVPAIVLLNLGGYNHFVVVTGIRDDAVAVSDPAIGAKVYPRDQFEKMWGKVAFLITARADLGAKYFNRPVDWKVNEKAPLLTAVPNPSLYNWTLMMRGPTDF
ncbi:C39 family peptidase [Neisseriaceae bacterium JH1-16]|nr:C39 family peptidase [Neisseriaceae bacterium JH1-16]